MAQTIPVYVWTMKDNQFDSTGLWVHLLLVDRYFIVGTQWPREETGWFTKRYVDAEEARGTAIFHTGQLEKTGDTLELGPITAMVPVNLDTIDRHVDHDVPSPTLDFIFDEVMMASVAA